MSIEALLENTSRHIKAIDICVEKNLRMPALILVYSGIDIFASLDRPMNKKEGSRKDFKEWCDKYLLISNELSCSAIDIYAARCGVVHSYSSESKLSREKEANEIVYSWGNQDPKPLQEVLQKIDNTTYVIHVETLVNAFKEGVNQFLIDIGKDKNKKELVVSRATKFFIDQPKEFWQ